MPNKLGGELQTKSPLVEIAVFGLLSFNDMLIMSQHGDGSARTSTRIAYCIMQWVAGWALCP